MMRRVVLPIPGTDWSLEVTGDFTGDVSLELCDPPDPAYDPTS